MATPLGSAVAHLHFVMSISSLHCGARVAALLFSAAPSFHSAAQSSNPPTAPTSAPPADVVLITASPYGSARSTAPVSVLTGETLVLRRGSTLGDTLSGLPGVAATGFGANASRPILRGLDGDRVRILNNAGGSVDASSLSFDHALPIDPLIINRLEVLRGPAALLYGGSAMGGVVNAIDNRIPAERLSSLGGAAELRLGGASRERAAAAWLEWGTARPAARSQPDAVANSGARAATGSLAWHVDAFTRSAGNLSTPPYQPREADGSLLPEAHEQRNSAARTSGAAVGGAWFAGATRLGLALDHYESRYGVVAEPDVSIAMRRDQVALAADFGEVGPAQSIQLQGHASDYQHQELGADGRVGTVFASQGQELRAQMRLKPLAGVPGLQGLLGLQLENTRFSALGEEAFVPSTRSRKVALFTLQEWTWGPAQWSAGARLEQAQVRSSGDDGARFGPPAQRDFALRSAALSAEAPLGAAWLASASLSHTERAPTYFELYANGVHTATGSYERGDSGLQPEQAHHSELALRYRQGPNQFRLGAFNTRFNRYVLLADTGQWVDAAGEPLPGAEANAALPLARFTPIPARWSGVELEARMRLWQRQVQVDAHFKLDTVRGRDTCNGQPLPRVPPLRMRVGLEADWQSWRAEWALEHAARQTRVPRTEATTVPATPSYTLMNLVLLRRLRWAPNDAMLYARLGNLGHRLAYNASATASIRGLAPLPGRAAALGLRSTY